MEAEVKGLQGGGSTVADGETNFVVSAHGLRSR
jgi:hypothetical protein